MITWPQVTENLQDWAQRLMSVLQLDLERELEEAKVPEGGIIAYPEARVPEGWRLADNPGLPALPAGMIWIMRG